MSCGFKKLQEAPRKEIVNHLNTLPKAKSVDMLDKGLTTNIFTIQFLQYSSKRRWQSLLILTFCLHSLPRYAFKVKAFFICYEDTLLPGGSSNMEVVVSACRKFS